MSFDLVVDEPAEIEIGEADAYFAQFGRADEFLALLDRVFEQLSERPLMYPVAYQNVRRALIPQFSFAVFFVVEPPKVVVLAVQHQRRDPAIRPQR